MNAFLFMFGFLSVLVLKPFNPVRNDEIYIKLCIGEESVKLQVWILSLVILLFMYSNNDAIGGFLTGTILFTFGKHIPTWMCCA
jgi:hypothetical protein